MEGDGRLSEEWRKRGVGVGNGCLWRGGGRSSGGKGDVGRRWVGKIGVFVRRGGRWSEISKGEMIFCVPRGQRVEFWGRKMWTKGKRNTVLKHRIAAQKTITLGQKICFLWVFFGGGNF